MPSLVRTIAFVVAISVLSLSVFPVLAQLNPIPATNDLGLAKDTSLLAAINRIINYFLGLVGLAAVIAIIYGGVKYIISQGDESNAAEAKRVILFAVIGLIVVGLAVVLTNFVVGAIQGR